MNSIFNCYCYKYGPLYVSWITTKNIDELIVRGYYYDDAEYPLFTDTRVSYMTVSFSERRICNRINKKIKQLRDRYTVKTDPISEAIKILGEVQNKNSLGSADYVDYQMAAEKALKNLTEVYY